MKRHGFVFHSLLLLAGSGLIDGSVMGAGGDPVTTDAKAGVRDSLAGEKAAQKLRDSIEEESYNLRYGPGRFQVEGGLSVWLNDNVFRSDNDRREDLTLNPEVRVKAWWPVSDLNVLRLSLGVGYEWYADNTQLNADAPLITPGTEVVFNIFAGDFRIKLHDRFSYQESLVINSGMVENERFFNFNDVGKFSRLENLGGFDVDWDLNKLILSAGYAHETFQAYTEGFDYLDRESELFSTSVSVLIGDKAKAGVEGHLSLNNFDEETVLNDHWRAKTGPFFDATLAKDLTLRVGAGYDTAEFDAPPGDNSDYDTYYAYARISQRARLFTHSLGAGREHLIGDNANNLQTTFVRYQISSPVVKNVILGAVLSVNFAEEFGGAFQEDFTYYRAGVRIGYQFHRYLRTDLRYDALVKESDLALRDFYQNRVTLGLVGRF
jgi:hypothetical protein